MEGTAIQLISVASVISYLEQPCCSHATTHTHGNDDVANTATSTFDKRVSNHPGSGHAVGMTDGNTTAVDVATAGIDPQMAKAVQYLYGKCLVQLPKTDVIDTQAVSIQKLGHGIHRAQPHFLRRAAGDSDAEITA